MRAKHVLAFEVDNHFCFNEICHVSILIYSSCVESCPCHACAPPREQSQFDIPAHEPLCIVSLAKALNHWQKPFLWYLMVKEIPQNSMVPHIASITHSACAIFLSGSYFLVLD